MYVVQFSYFDFDDENPNYDTVEYLFTDMEDAVRFGHYAAYGMWDEDDYDGVAVPKDIYLFEAQYREVSVGGGNYAEGYRFDSGSPYLCTWANTDKNIRVRDDA